MHTEIDYSDYETPQDMHEAAIADVKEWFGGRYEKIIANFRKHSPMPDEQFELIMSFGGVKGYPVRALRDEIWPYG